MPDNRKVIYWDACVSLSYLNEIPERVQVLEPLLASSSSDNGSIKIHTSSISRVEVAFGAVEKEQQALDPEVEGRINNLWRDPGAIVCVDYHEGIEEFARQLIRGSITQGWRLKPLDAIHISTAMWLCKVGIQVAEFHTYDIGLHKYSSLAGFQIIEPYALQPNLL